MSLKPAVHLLLCVKDRSDEASPKPTSTSNHTHHIGFDTIVSRERLCKGKVKRTERTVRRNGLTFSFKWKQE